MTSDRAQRRKQDTHESRVLRNILEALGQRRAYTIEVATKTDTEGAL
jgi:hypothetical protein